MRQRYIGRTSKLTAEQAREIREAFVLREQLTNKALARKFSLSNGAVTSYGLDRVKRVRQGATA